MLTRLAAALCALAALTLASAAHEGHDHGGEDRAAVSPAVPAGPRAEAASPAYELVAVPGDRDLLLYLDRFATNEPVSGARLDVETPDGPATAVADGDGRYRLPAPWLARGGEAGLLVTVTEGPRVDVLALDLRGTAPAAAPPPPDHGASAPGAFAAAVRAHLAHQGPVGAAAGGFLLGLATIVLARARRSGAALAVLAATLTLLIGGAALAHEGHGGEGHGEEGHAHGEPTADAPGRAALLDPAAPRTERARRLADGSVFVPKAIQHLLGLRTVTLAQAAHRRTLSLPGRIIADPDASGVVQSSVGGRLSAAPGGFPGLGARVARGDVLALVTPPVQAVDASDMRQTQGDLDQQIAILVRRVARFETLAPGGVVAQTALDDARAELAGLRDRRAALDAQRREPETLTAPVDGVVAERAAVAGQMAAPGTMVFRIVDPDRLYVEALSFAAVAPDRDVEDPAATARLPDGRVLALAYRGSGLADRAGAFPVQFAVRGGTAGLRLGQLVTVLAPAGGGDDPSAPGLALPRAAVVRAEGGPLVYAHVAPERFDARPVRVEPLDAGRVVAAAGVAAGQRVVSAGAELLDQIR